MNSVFRLTKGEKLETEHFSQAYTQGSVVFVLCAAWCGTCKGFEETIAEIAQEFSNTLFIWLDIEDDAAVAGDIDVLNFPSFAVFREGVGVHYGVSLPHQGVVKRLLSALLNNPIHAADIPEEVLELPENVKEFMQKI